MPVSVSCWLWLPPVQPPLLLPLPPSWRVRPPAQQCASLLPSHTLPPLSTCSMAIDQLCVLNSNRLCSPTARPPHMQCGHRPAVRARVLHRGPGRPVLASAHLQGAFAAGEGLPMRLRCCLLCRCHAESAAVPTCQQPAPPCLARPTSHPPLPVSPAQPPLSTTSAPLLPFLRWWRWTGPTSRSSPRAAPAAGRG